MKALILILPPSLTLSAFGQTPPDSGFTNKAEAKNLMVNGLKEGKWIEYYDTDLNLSGSGEKILDFPVEEAYLYDLYINGQFIKTDKVDVKYNHYVTKKLL